ncbi:MAG: DUF563 domain-containing protein [Leptolyngbyaceae cyanobacterium CRU_2_3]|nr:DUF563 domain-containing protein [Leptolyngbyaceae cyanobacterium CRU_2_3]
MNIIGGDRLQPGYIKSYNNLGCTLAKLDRLEEAIQVYQQAIALQPDWAILHNNLGQALFEQSPVLAVAAYRRAIALQPDLALAHYNLGKALQLQGQHQQAIGCFEQAMKLAFDPAFDPAIALNDLSLSWIALGHWQRALAGFQAAIISQKLIIQAYCDWVKQLSGQDELTQARIACAQFLQGLLQLQFPVADDSVSDLTGDLTGDAIGDATDGLTGVGVALAQTYWHWGNVLTAYGGKAQYQQAEQYYQQALKLQPDDLNLHLNLANCLVKQERFSAALWVCHLGLAIHPHHPHLYAQLGHILKQQQQWAVAIAYYQKALEKPALVPWRKRVTQPDHLAVQQRVINVEPCFESTHQSNYPAKIYQTTQEWFTTEHPPNSQYLCLQPVLQPALPASHSSDTCPGLNCSPCLKRIFDRFNLIHLGNGVHTWQGSKPSTDTSSTDISSTDISSTGNTKLAIASFPLFIAVIPDGKAWATPQQNSWQICNAIAILTDKHTLLADLSRDYPGQLPDCPHSHPDRHRIFSSTLTAPKPIQGRVAALAGLSGHNYFHWMVDILPRLELLRQHGVDWESIDWFWINRLDHPFQRETLSALGISPTKVLESDQHPYIQADQLVVPSFAGHLGWLDPWALEFLRNAFLSVRPSSQVDSPQRIYISRAQADHRRVLNEAEVIHALLPFGFVPVTLETLSFAEQVALFARADVVIAPHGGGLTNILFCRPGTTVVELVSPHYIRHYYWVISDRLHLNHYFLAGETLTCNFIRQLMYPSSLTEDIWIDSAALQRLAQTLNLS